MQQKVQFIVTIIHEPELLIFDEPFSGFDPINVNLIKDEILELRKKGSTIIFSTHNMASVEELCDHIALIDRSKKFWKEVLRKSGMQINQIHLKSDFKGSCPNSIQPQIVISQLQKNKQTLIIPLQPSNY